VTAPRWAGGDIVVACADLAGRSGAVEFDLGYVHDDVPVEQAGWYATATFRGAKLLVQDQPSPEAAALALAHRLLRGATCRCHQAVTLNDTTPGCRWRLVGQRWEPGCTASPIRIPTVRGDLAAMRRAFDGRDER
jgi:hypothetical protein